MDRLRAIEVFAAIAEHGSFAAAADQLGISRNMASRHVADLEAHLGARLFHRTTRSVSLTSLGAGYLQTAQEVLTRLDEADRAAGLHALQPHGHLSVSAPMVFGVRHIAPHLDTFAKLHPQVSVDLTLNDRMVNLVEEGFDVAVRIGKLRDSSLLARRIADVELMLVASPDYLSAAGTPTAPEELSGHDCIAYTVAEAGRWDLRHASGERASARLNANFSANNGDAIEQLACAGCGIALQPDFICHEDLASGRLVQVLPGWSGGTIGVHVLASQKRYRPMKVAAFSDWLAKLYKPAPFWHRMG